MDCVRNSKICFQLVLWARKKACCFNHNPISSQNFAPNKNSHKQNAFKLFQFIDLKFTIHLFAHGRDSKILGDGMVF